MGVQRIKVNFPKAGMGIDEGTVQRWLKGIGDTVYKGEALIEIETAKALQEVVAPESGTLVEILVEKGQVTAVNTTLGTIESTDG